MAKCPFCKKDEDLEICADCNGSGNASSGTGYCPFCNGERKVCINCQI